MKTNIKWRVSDSLSQYVGMVGSLELFAINIIMRPDEVNYDLHAMVTQSFQSALYEDVNSRTAAVRCYHFRLTNLAAVQDAAERVFIEYIKGLAG